MRTIVAVVLCLGGVAACTGNPPPSPLLPAPSPLADSAAPEPASLVRRVAEAADGFRDGKDRYVLADRLFPHKVLGVFMSRKEAEDSLARATAPEGSEYKVYGPFRTPEDTGYVEIKGEEIVEVIVVTADGKRKSYDGKVYDAMFWGMPAFDKFVAPYLTCVYGVKYAALQRDLYLRGKSLMVHSTQVTHYRSSF